MRRWVRYEAPVMACVEIDDEGYQGKIVNIVLATDHEDIGLSRDYRGQFLVYDELMQRVENQCRSL